MVAMSSLTHYTEREVGRALDCSGLSLEDITYLIPHQANKRISIRLQKSLGLPSEKVLSKVEHCGNTGCCVFGIELVETLPLVTDGETVVLAVFDGGYSFGCMVITCLS